MFEFKRNVTIDGTAYEAGDVADLDAGHWFVKGLLADGWIADRSPAKEPEQAEAPRRGRPPKDRD